MQKNKLVDSILFKPVFFNKRKLAKQLTGKTILITGASSGIGEQLTYVLGDFHCHLILVARRGEKLSEVKKAVERKCATVSIFPTDLRNQDEMKELINYLLSLPHGLDIVISNAGLSIKRSIYDSLDRFHDFSRTMAINYFAPVQLLLSLIPLLQKTQGKIINVSTINAMLAPVPNFAAYQASKSSIDVWLRSVSPELRKEGITTTSIYLPLVKTPMILPTEAYRHMPALSANYAAKIICKSIYLKKKTVKPWWLIFGQILSLFMTNLWDVSNFNRKKRR
ncbi:MAG TPA: SDR family NAD(P)-dependent oxidoreductase [Ureibacillus sp.]|nr:SDR family NAD(P)-dependent oxidoreductase [Ureibacillus sp.]